jgi:hypothetical protein
MRPNRSSLGLLVLLLALLVLPSAAFAQPDGGTTPTSIPGSGTGIALLSDVRAEAHAGFDRVVFEFENPVQPGVAAEYVQRPLTADPSGEEIAISGEAILSVRMFPASGVDLSGETFRETYTGPTRIAANLPVLIELVEVGDFEAQLTWALGLRGQVPFTVRTLADPSRVEVDVAHLAVPPRPVPAAPRLTG